MSDALTSVERRIGASLAAIFGLRMLGLFLILPVFALHARNIPGGDDLTLVGLALGAYGLTQACLQIAWGNASDRLGRKPVIVAGLLLFAAGSAVAAMSATVSGIIAGRVLQGAGAISAVVTALAADLIPEGRRARVMAMIGASIGLVFAGSLVMAPILYGWFGMSGIFWLTGALALGAIVLLLKAVPDPPRPLPAPSVPVFSVLRNPRIARLNFGVFVLHLTQMALWVLVPAALAREGNLAMPRHWQVYLPAVLLSFGLMVPAVIAAEKKGRMQAVFSAAIVLLMLALAGFALAAHGLWSLGIWLTLFFAAFNILEATQPALISRLAPPQARGKALGLYNTAQALGLFTGGAAGGALAERLGGGAVYAACGALCGVWFLLSRQIAGWGRTMRQIGELMLEVAAWPAPGDIAPGDEVLFYYSGHEFDRSGGAGERFTANGEPFHDFSGGTQGYPLLMDPMRVRVGDGRLVTGIDLGLEGTLRSNYFQLFLTADLAYGDRYWGTVPAGSPVVFRIDIREVIKQQP
jgi:MFS family permease